MEKTKKSIFETPLLSTKIKSANAKIFPEGALGYFLGPTLALIANSVLSTYLNRYFTEILNLGMWGSLDGVNPNGWGNTFLTLLPVVSVVFIILGNILVGRLMDRNKTKAGKARPLLLLAIPLSILALLVLFIISPFATETSEQSTQILAVILLAVGYNLWFAIAYPFYYTSHAALVNLSTRNSKDRSLLATIANATTLAAMGLCTMILPFFIDNLHVLFVNGDPNAAYGHWKVLAIALMAVTALGTILEYYFTRERITEESFKAGAVQTEKKSVPIGKQLKICFKDKFWIIMIIFFFLYQLGGMLKNVSQLYYCQAYFDADVYNSMSATLAIIGAVPTALGMVIAWPLSNKIGKGRAILFGAILATIGGAIGFFAPGNFYVVAASFAIKALGSTPAMYLSLALLADILDHQEAQHGVRTDGLTMTIYGAIMAGMTGIATGLMNGIYGAVGRTANIVDTPPVQAASLWLFIGGETICYVIIAVIFIFMGVEKFTKFDHKAITMDQKAAAEAEGVEYIDAATKLAQEEAEAAAASDEARKAELKAKCDKKGLDFEQEEAKYQAAKAEKEKAAAAKKQAAEEKKAAAEKAKQEKYDALSDEQKAAISAKEAKKAEKKAAHDAKVLAEFNALREKNGRPALAETEE
ncbi:MAG: MFS transporter [Clostridiales bacterium]|nr:MFS transporter [Clostridiales bacterium]